MRQLVLRLPTPPIERFRAKCVFNPISGCVLWIGGVSHGGGRYRPYPTFWDGQRTIRGHIWAAENIHRLERPRGYHVDHECRVTLCVQHLRILPGAVNTTLGNQTRLIPVEDTWNDVPWHTPPAWMGEAPVSVYSMREFILAQEGKLPKRRKLKKGAVPF